MCIVGKYKGILLTFHWGLCIHMYKLKQKFIHATECTKSTTNLRLIVMENLYMEV